jgi:hypothetical protein
LLSHRKNGRSRDRMTSMSLKARCLSSICALMTLISQVSAEGDSMRPMTSRRRERDDPIKSIFNSPRPSQLNKHLDTQQVIVLPNDIDLK